MVLPVFGIKTLAMTDGELFLRGKEVSPTWSLLEATAAVGDSSIQVQGATNWQVGDEIVIAGTGLASERSCTLKRTDDKCESEERKIAALSETGGVTTITLDKPLEYEHLGEGHSVGGETMETRAEVLHLTRSILAKGRTAASEAKEAQRSRHYCSLSMPGHNPRFPYCIFGSKLVFNIK